MRQTEAKEIQDCQRLVGSLRMLFSWEGAGPYSNMISLDILTLNLGHSWFLSWGSCIHKTLFLCVFRCVFFRAHSSYTVHRFYQILKGNFFVSHLSNWTAFTVCLGPLPWPPEFQDLMSCPILSSPGGFSMSHSSSSSTMNQLIDWLINW